MRGLGSCSRLLSLLLLLLCCSLCHGQTTPGPFEQCDDKNARCFIFRECINSHPPHTSLVRNDADITCKRGYDIRMISKQQWKFVVDCVHQPDASTKPKCYFESRREDTEYNFERSMLIALHEHNVDEEWTVKFVEKQFTVKLLSSETAEYGNIRKHFTLTTANLSLSDDLELYHYTVRFGSLKDPWLSGGTNIYGDVTDFLFFFPDVCSKTRLKNEGVGTEVAQLKMESTIFCIPPHSLIFGGISVPSGSVTCSEDGWKNDGKFVWKHSSEAQIESEIPVVCRTQCHKDNRKVGNIKNDIVKNELSCDGDREAIKITFPDGAIERTGKAIKCEDGIGWKELDNGIPVNPIIQFGQHGILFNATCEPSCTESLIETDLTKSCKTGPKCEMPTMKDNHKIVCEDVKYVLFHKEDGSYHKNHILCDTHMFKHELTDKVFPRRSQSQKIEVACVSKCDPSFTKRNTGTNTLQENYIDAIVGGKREILCKSNNDYLKIGPIPTITDESATCDPTFGWKTSVSGDIILEFERNEYELGVDCVNACAKRIVTLPCPTEIKPKYWIPATPDAAKNSHFCPDTHVMRVEGVNTELMSEWVTCTRDGLFKSKNGVVDKNDKTLLLKFNPKNLESEKLRIACVSKCTPGFLKVVPRNSYEFEGTDDDILTCRGPTDVLEINGNRVFGELKCDAKGWKDEAKVVAPFTTTIHLEAKCTNVCSEKLIANVDAKCIESGTCHQFLLNKLTCPSGSFALFVDKKQSRHKVECTKEGWIDIESSAKQTTLVNFKEVKSLLDVISVECRELCATSFIKNEDGSHTFKNKILSCGPDDTIALFFDDKEVKGEVECTADGWFELTSPSKTKLVDFKAEGAILPHRPKVECKKFCSESLIDKATCATGAFCGEHTFSDATKQLSCGTDDTVVLFLDGHETTGVVKCSRNGWTQTVANPTPSTATIADFTQQTTPQKVKAECREQCAVSLISPQEMQSKFSADKKLSCGSADMALFVDGKETKDDVKCTRDGWFDGTVSLVDFKLANRIPKPVTVECKSKCDPYFVKIENTCIAATDGPACTKAKYEDGKLSCGHATDKLVFSHLATPVEIFANLTCSIEKGWEEDNEGKKTIVNPGPGKFAIEAKCIRVCDESALTKLTAATGSRSYARDGILTCKDEKEMLQFDQKDVYSDVVCSKEGWKKLGEDTVLIQYSGAAIKADCIPNPCTKDGIEQCTPPPGGVCQQPDITTTKYRMFCSNNTVLKYGQATTSLPDLTCKDGKWVDTIGSAVSSVQYGQPLAFRCAAGKCAQCPDDLNAKKISCDGNNLNCVPPDNIFTKGSDNFCSYYQCNDAYKHIVGDDVKYYTGKIKADNDCKYKTEDDTEITGTFGCIKQIPCSVNSPLDFSCQTNVSSNVTCEPNLPERYLKSERNGQPEPTVKCNAEFKLYHHDGKKWEEVSLLQCTKSGNWKATFGSTMKDVEHRERFVCANKDPTIIPTTPPPPPTEKSVCDLCKGTFHKRTCDICRESDDAIIFAPASEKCSAKSAKGSKLITDRGEVDEMLCKKEGNEYVWRTPKGEKVKEFAAQQGGPSTSSFSGWAIGGIVIGAILIFVVIGGVVAFVMYRRKQKALATERLKSKGLEQKMDSIIDNVSVTDDPKTLVI